MISSIAPVSGLPILKTLDVSDNSITDISPAMGLPKLKDLMITGTKVSDAQINAMPPTVTVTK